MIMTWYILVSLFNRFFFFNDTATTEIYTLSLHDALPISRQGPGDPDRAAPRRAGGRGRCREAGGDRRCGARQQPAAQEDRKSTRLNSSHPSISYAVFCLKKKKTLNRRDQSV